MSNSPHSSCPVGQVLWNELLEEVILHITPLCSLLHILLKDVECVCWKSENCKSLVLQDRCNIEIFLSPACLLTVQLLRICQSLANNLDFDQTPLKVLPDLDKKKVQH